MSGAAYTISTEKSRLDLDVIHPFLAASYWSPGIARVTVQQAIAGSMCFGVYHQAAGATRPAQVGFARVITDTATYAYLADVFILESHRGKGLSKLLMQTILAHPDLQGLRRFALATRDAHGLYKQFGFDALAMPDRMMEKRNPTWAADRRWLGGA